MAVSSPNNQTVLITGINGYIASVLGLYLLEAGYTVRGTTRRLASAEPLLKGSYAPYFDRVKIYEVSDMTIPGAFDEAAKDVHGIFHTASPIDFSLQTYAQMVTPAVSGTTTLLNSALQSGPQLKAVVLTSSVIAVINPRTDAHTFTESDFSSAHLAQAESDLQFGAQTPGGVLYGASKTAADRAVWKFRNGKNPSWAITTINPGVVIGPPIILPSSGAKLNETLRPLYNMLSGKTKTVPPDIGTGSFVDVRDVAFMHIWAYEHPEKSDGERYIGCSGFGPLQAQADILRAYFKGKGEEEILKKLPIGSPGEGYVGFDQETGKVGNVEWVPGRPNVSGQKAEKIMGFKYRNLVDSTIETAVALKSLL